MMKAKPVKKYKVGGVQAAIWENQAANPQGQQETFHSVTLERRYKDRDGNWKTSESFRAGDLPKAILLLSKAYEFVALKEVDQENGGDVV